MSHINTQMAVPNKVFNIGFAVLLIFLLLRPISLIMAGIRIGPFSFFELFGIVISYILLIPFLLNLRYFALNRTIILCLLFIVYCYLSFFWGSSLVFIERVTLPFLVYFVTHLVLTEEKQISLLLKAVIIGYVFPILSSFYGIMRGIDVSYTDYFSKITRYEGAFPGTHQLAYAMLFFIFFSFLLLISEKIEKKKKFLLIVFLLISLVCLYKSYTRTAYVGFIVFGSLCMLRLKKKYIASICILFILVALVTTDKAEQIFWKTEDHDVNEASSGRLELWTHNFDIFKKAKFANKILGLGLGCEGTYNKEYSVTIEPSHNDYLSLLMTLGIVGLSLYLALFISILYDIYISKIGKSKKLYFLGIILSALVMNILSNAVIFRIELSQYLWFLIGIFYFLNNNMPKSQGIMSQK